MTWQIREEFSFACSLIDLRNDVDNQIAMFLFLSDLYSDKLIIEILFEEKENEDFRILQMHLISYLDEFFVEFAR